MGRGERRGRASILFYEIVAVHKLTHLFMRAEDRPNTVSGANGSILGSASPKRLWNRDELLGWM